MMKAFLSRSTRSTRPYSILFHFVLIYTSREMSLKPNHPKAIQSHCSTNHPSESTRVREILARFPILGVVGSIQAQKTSHPSASKPSQTQTNLESPQQPPSTVDSAAFNGEPMAPRNDTPRQNDHVDGVCQNPTVGVAGWGRNWAVETAGS